MSWWDHVHYLGSTRVSNRSSTSNDENGTSGDTLVGFDPVMVILRTIEYSDRTLECHWVIGVGEVLLGECWRDDGSLHDRTVE